jgi:hypothetical protein
MIELELTGLEAVQKKFGEVGSQNILIPPMQASLYLLQSYMSDYGLLSKKATAHHTGTLGRRWTTTPPVRISNGVRGEVGNNTSYAPWVQSSRFQVAWHRGFWQTDEMAMRALTPQITEMFNDALAQALRA